MVSEELGASESASVLASYMDIRREWVPCSDCEDSDLQDDPMDDDEDLE